VYDVLYIKGKILRNGWRRRGREYRFARGIAASLLLNSDMTSPKGASSSSSATSAAAVSTAAAPESIPASETTQVASTSSGPSPYGTRKKQINSHMNLKLEITGHAVGGEQTTTQKRPSSSARRKRSPRRDSHDMSGSKSRRRGSSLGHESMLNDPATLQMIFPSQGGSDGSGFTGKNLSSHLCTRILNSLFIHGRLSLQSLVTLLPDLGNAIILKEQTIAILEVLEVLGIVKCMKLIEESVTDSPRSIKRRTSEAIEKARKAKEERESMTDDEREALQAARESALLQVQNQAQTKLTTIQDAQLQHTEHTKATQSQLLQAQDMRTQQIDQVLAQLKQLRERVVPPTQTQEEATIIANHLVSLDDWLKQANAQKDAAQAQIDQHAAQQQSHASSLAQQVVAQQGVLATAQRAVQESATTQTLLEKHTNDCHYALAGYAKGNSDIPEFSSELFQNCIDTKRKNTLEIRSRINSLIELSNTWSSHTAAGTSNLRTKRKKGEMSNTPTAHKVTPHASDSTTKNNLPSNGLISESTSIVDDNIEKSGRSPSSERSSRKNTSTKQKNDRLSKLRALVASFIETDVTLRDDLLYRALEEGGLNLGNMSGSSRRT
jgi:hypothetical protein